MGRILIVDDDPDIREVLSALLRRDGHDVTTAAEGQAAMRALEAHGAPCVILLDLMMPGMDGWSFRERQRADPALASIPVIVLSGIDDLRGRAESLGASSVLRKPFSAGPLREAVERFCGMGRGALQLRRTDAGTEHPGR